MQFYPLLFYKEKGLIFKYFAIPAMEFKYLNTMPAFIIHFYDIIIRVLININLEKSILN